MIKKSSLIILVLLAYSYCWSAQSDIENYQYRLKYVVTEGGSKALTNYETEIFFQGNYSTASYYLNFDHLTSTYDVCITSGDAVTLISFFNQYIDTTTKEGTFFQKTPNLDLNGSATFYLYYGSTAEPDHSDGENTFWYFDDFLGTGFPQNWAYANDATNCHPVLENSVLRSSWTGEGGWECENLKSSETITRPFIMEGRIKKDNATGTGSWSKMFGLSCDASTNQSSHPDMGWFQYQYSGGNNWILRNNASDTNQSATEKDTDWHDYKWVFTDGKQEGYKDGVLKHSDTDAISAADFYIYVSWNEDGTTNPWSMRYDWIFVRQYVDPEPTREWFTEEANPYYSEAPPPPAPTRRPNYIIIPQGL